jgi:hypothetical protein
MVPQTYFLQKFGTSIYDTYNLNLSKIAQNLKINPDIARIQDKSSSAKCVKT